MNGRKEDLTPKSEQEQFDVKEEQEENLPSRRTSDPFPLHRTLWLESDPYPEQDTDAGTSEAPWRWVLNQLRSVQHNLEKLRSRVGEVEARHDIRELREGQEGLSTRVHNVEECVHCASCP